MDIKEIIQNLMGGGVTDVPKNIPGVGDIVDAIKRGMQPKKREPGQDYPKRVKVTT